MPTPEICPHCGAAVPPRAKACPACGSCEATGWSEEAPASSLDLPDEEFEYDDFARREFGDRGTAPPRGISRLWWLVAILAAILVLVLALR
jgi:hypothetical protein